MLKTTCAIQPGASGGAIVRPNGDVIGIVVSNTTFNDVTYPKLNMSVPVCVIYDIIERYIVHEGRFISLPFYAVRDGEFENVKRPL